MANARFQDLNGYASASGGLTGTGSGFSGTTAGRIIYFDGGGTGGLGGNSLGGSDRGRRAMYVPLNAEGNTPDGRQRIIKLNDGEGYTHR